ncbi:MAG TPA: hypothetical protein VE079_14085 [Ensifer sp.]|nr:hypothetical protein [Ensifer sp.]
MIEVISAVAFQIAHLPTPPTGSLILTAKQAGESKIQRAGPVQRTRMNKHRHDRISQKHGSESLGMTRIMQWCQQTPIPRPKCHRSITP